ncbi:MAG TPA: TIGR04290 family methyltransferase [Rhodanobacteraceae bacterium]|nr:TIGR04290 family methyltransferase [Rhodanobacteraceae bacterium]
MNASLRTLQSRGAGEGPLARNIRQLGPWFHNLHLRDGVQTAPDHPLGDFPACKWQRMAGCLPEDLGGWQVLDIGCNAGFYSFELARRGARVTAMDHDDHYLRQAFWAARELDLTSRIEFRHGDIFELAGSEERYDLVLFLGVFYHLRYPLLGLDLAAAASRKLLLVQSLATAAPANEIDTADPGFAGRDALRQDGWPKMAYIEHELAGDPSNWWVPNPPAMEAMLRSAGLRIAARPDEDSWLCERGASADAADCRLQTTLRRLGVPPSQDQ